jgi:hypothetical protein
MIADRLSKAARRTARALALAVVLPGPVAAQTGAGGWVIDAGTARGLLQDGALLLDARDDALRAAQGIEAPVPVAWQLFSEPDLPVRG